MLIDDLAKSAAERGVNLYGICQYQNGQYHFRRISQANQRNNVYSVAKSVTSMVVGTLIESGKLALSDTVASVFPQAGEGWETVEVRHLLTHTTGYAQGGLDIDQEDVSDLGEDFLFHALSLPLVYPPGERMVYSDANYYLLSRIATEKSGSSLFSLAQRQLFAPMGIVGAAWAVCPRGFSMGATGLFLSTLDMAKLGVLLLQNGAWNGRQLVPARWVREASEGRVRCDARTDYGYGFWRHRRTDAFWARGMLGQLIYVDPARQTVVAWQGCSDNDAQLLDDILDAAPGHALEELPW